jgi:hypothetical protein
LVAGERIAFVIPAQAGIHIFRVGSLPHQFHYNRYANLPDFSLLLAVKIDNPNIAQEKNL